MPDSERYNFTQRVRAAFQIARTAAEDAGSEAVTPEHIAVGMLREGQGVAVTALRFHGVAREALEREILEHLPPHSVRTQGGDISFDARAKQLLADARAEARALGHAYVGTEHLLLALLRDTAGRSAQILARHSFGLDEARARVRWLLESDPLNPKPFVSSTGAVPDSSGP